MNYGQEAVPNYVQPSVKQYPFSCGKEISLAFWHPPPADTHKGLQQWTT